MRPSRATRTGSSPGPDGNLWYAAFGKDRIGRIVPSPVTVLGLPTRPSPATVTVTQGHTAVWTFFGPGVLSATDTSGMGLFDSGTMTFVRSYGFTFVGSGSYPYEDTGNSSTASVKVPVLVTPATGASATSFQVTWASRVAPAGFVYDIQIARPGVPTFTAWRTGVTSAGGTFVPDAGVGTYRFRARLRRLSNGAHSGYSPAKAIVVS